MTPRAAAAAVMAFALPACATVGIREGGFNIISVEQEWRMRDDIQREVAREKRLVDDPQALAFLNQLGRQLAAQTPLADRRWDFGIIEDDSINAMNLPGGLVYVHTGLAARAETLDQFAGVVAHEVAHGGSRHGTQLLTRAYGYSVIASIVLGRDPGLAQRVVAEIVGTGVVRNYGRDAEREADRLAVGYMFRAGYDPRGLPSFFRVLQGERRRRPTRLEQFLSSHPVTEERIEIVEREIARLPARGGLVRDSPAYQAFRSRLR